MLNLNTYSNKFKNTCPGNLPSMRLFKLSDISTDKIYVVKLCSIHFLVLVCEGLHEINSSDMTSILSYISCKTSVNKSTGKSKNDYQIKN